MFLNFEKPAEIVSGVPIDESVRISAIETLNFSNLDLRKNDFLLWDSYPWLSDEGFKFIIGRVVEASLMNTIASGLIIEAIIDDCSGESQTSRDRGKWSDPFESRWQELTETELLYLVRWLNFLEKSDGWVDERASIEECKKTIAWLQEHEINVIAL